MATPSLSALQKSINSNPRLRAQFLKDPAGVLAKNGLDLPAAKAKQLSDFTKEVTAAKGTVAVGGLSRKVIGAGANARVEVTVSVTVKF